MVSTQSNNSNELYNLRWNSYFTNLVNVFMEHQTQETLVDVTLSCEGQFIKAHKLVLSACSSYFQKLFQNHTTAHVVILLNDVKFKDLQLVVQFMYKGEVKVADSDMQQFLSLGKMLQVKGLCSVELGGEKQKLQTNGENKETETKIPEMKKGAKTTNTELKEMKESPTLKKRKLPTPETPESKKKSMKPGSPAEPDVSHTPRPPNAFMIFANQWRKKLAVEHPSESNKDISVRLGNMWKSLSPEEKDTFYEEAKKADEEHKQKHPGPKEAGQKKTIASMSKSGDILDMNDPDFMEIKCEDKFTGDSDHSTSRSNGTKV